MFEKNGLISGVVLLGLIGIAATLVLPSQMPIAEIVVERHFALNGAVAGVWMLFAAILILFMQVGFLLLEAGSVRSKNAINVAQKNATDWVVCSLVFFLFSFQIMFGQSITPFFGFGGIDLTAQGGSPLVVMIFQFGFCAAAASIVSGAVAERMHFSAYICMTFVMALLIYPLTAHMVWGQSILIDNTPYLAGKGFIDFAGSTVVHVVAGSVALAAIIVVGPRTGRFDADGKPVQINGHSAVLAFAGTMILFIGWLGFNSGAADPSSSMLPVVIANTIIAATFGAVSGLVIGYYLDGRIFRPSAVINGMLAGLIAITAGCATVALSGAALIGLTGGVISTIMSVVLLHKFRLDDPLDVVAVHGFSGIAGTLLVAVFAAPSSLVDGSRISQLLVQIECVGIAVVWSFFIAFCALKILDRFKPIRVSIDDEMMGLNMSEHGVTMGTDRLRYALDKELARSDKGQGIDTSQLKLDVEAGEDTAEIATAFNAIVDHHAKTLAQVDKLREAADAANTAKSDFLANMSHEIRTPMNGVMGMAELLAATDLNPKQKMFADVIVKSGSALLTIINDILDFSKIEAGQMELDLAPFDLGEAIEDVAALMSGRAVQKGLELIVRIDPMVPQMVVGDAGRLRQIVSNLVGNAVKFTEQGHVLIDVSLSQQNAAVGEVSVVLSIFDTGIGIAADKISRVFEKFNQADTSATRKHQGTGLGLSISSSLAELMGSKISIESALGQGSRFWLALTLPIAEGRRPVQVINHPQGRCKALIVDDCAQTRAVLTEHMATIGFEHAAASNGAEALAFCHYVAKNDHRIDVILLDYQMPEMSGLEVIKRLRRELPRFDVPVILLTSNEDKALIEQLHHMGATYTLTKPVRGSLLRNTVTEVVVASFNRRRTVNGNYDDLAVERRATSRRLG
jgi:ammonium transporter, Amt family